jgi:endoglycosylceramidase
MFLLLILAASACRNIPDLQNLPSVKGPIRVQGPRFTDQHGREVVFQGINLVNKDPEQGYLGRGDEAAIRQLAESGFNCIRLGIFWDALEPEPGRYDDAYLDSVALRVEWACENGIFVFLDMHQDLYSRKYSDGAPGWATLDDGLPHYTGPVWSDSYLISPAVQRAFDQFWDNASAADGVGLQDHYARAWQKVAQRFAGNPCVIGYDLMNEPFPGSEAAGYFPLMLEAYAVLLKEDGTDVPSAEDLAAQWSTEEGRVEAMQNLQSAERFGRVVDAVYAANSRFEQERLQPFYQKVASAVRKVDSTSILLLEHSYFCNSGVRSAITGTVLPDGSADPQVAYAPHGYDPLTDTKGLGDQGPGRIEFIFNRISETGAKLGMPVIVGEWGALGGQDPAHVRTSAVIMEQIGRHGFGQTYWAWYPSIGGEPYFQEAIVRPFPAAIAGELKHWQYDIATGSFECAWTEQGDCGAPTLIYIPNLEGRQLSDVRIAPAPGNQGFEAVDSGALAWLLIPALGRGAERNLSFVWRKTPE